MKKAFIQKLSIAMASALVITAATPATADAAAKMKLNKTSKTLYVNKDNKSGTSNKYDFNILNKGTGKYSYSWSTGDKKVATVNSKGVVTAKGVGTTKVTCKVTYKTGKKKGDTYKKLTANVTVKANAAKVVINNAPENNQISVGTTFDFNRTMTAANGGKATDKTEWFLFADEALTKASDVATIDKNGVVTANKAGEFYVVAKTYQSAKYKEAGYTAVSEAVKITVPLQMTGASATALDKMELTFDSSVKDLIKTANDIQIVSVATNQVKFPVKSYTISEDGKKVTVETYKNFSNDTTYKITVDKMSKETKAVFGEIASIVVENQNFAPVEISKNKKAGDLKYKVFDANGVDVSKNYGFDKLVVISSRCGNSEVKSNGEVWLDKKGDQVTVELKYFKHNSTTGADESIKSNQAVITAAEAVATQTVKYGIADAGKDKEAFEKKEMSIAAEATGKKLYVKLKDSYGNEFFANKFESLDKNILGIDDQGNLYPQVAGTARIKVSNGDYFDYLTITVLAKAEAVSLSVSTNNVSLSNTENFADTRTVKVTLKGTYGDTYKKTGTGKIYSQSVSDAVLANGHKFEKPNEDMKVNFVNGEADIIFTVNAHKTGNASFRVEFEGKIAIITVSVKEPKGSSSYRIEMDKTEICNFKEDGSHDEAIVTIYNVDASDVATSYASDKDVIVKVKKGKDVVKDYDGVTLTNGTFTIDASKLEAGDYTVEITSGPITRVKEFKVTTKKASASVKVDNNTVETSGSSVADALKSAMTFSVDGTVIDKEKIKPTFEIAYCSNMDLITATKDNGSFTNGTLNLKKSGDSVEVRVKKVTWTYTDGKGVNIPCSADVNESITIKLK